MDVLATIVASAITAVFLGAFFAFFSGKDFASGFVTSGLIILVISIFSRQGHLVVGVLVGFPIAIGVAIAIGSLRKR
jgi:hypothetical protein